MFFFTIFVTLATLIVTINLLIITYVAVIGWVFLGLFIVSFTCLCGMMYKNRQKYLNPNKKDDGFCDCDGAMDTVFCDFISCSCPIDCDCTPDCSP